MHRRSSPRNSSANLEPYSAEQPVQSTDHPGHILRKVYNCTETKNFLPQKIYSIFYVSTMQNAADKLTTAQTISSDLSCIIHSANFQVFTPLFHSHISKFTTTTAQLPYYNCKLHFTTAEIVISGTLIYAPKPPVQLHLGYSQLLSL